MNYTNQMVSVPCELLEQALDAAAAVGMQDVADELDRILTPPTTAHQVSTAVLWRHREKKPNRVWNYTANQEIAERASRMGYEVQGFADIREVERLRDANLHHRNLQIEADDLIESLRKQLSEIQQAAGAVLAARDPDDYPHGHPGHCHDVHGQWDSTGAPCLDCAAYDRLEALAGSAKPSTPPTELTDVLPTVAVSDIREAMETSAAQARTAELQIGETHLRVTYHGIKWHHGRRQCNRWEPLAIEEFDEILHQALERRA